MFRKSGPNQPTYNEGSTKSSLSYTQAYHEAPFFFKFARLVPYSNKSYAPEKTNLDSAGH